MRAARGWTLVEMIVVVAVLGTLAAFVAPVLVQALGAYEATDASVATYAKMRYAMERMAREIREVRRAPADTANFDISAMSAASLSFVKDDGTEVTLGSSGSTLTLGYTGTASGTLTDQVGAFALAYLQQDGTTAAAGAADVAFVQVSMTLVEGANNYASRLRVDLRNPQ